MQTKPNNSNNFYSRLNRTKLALACTILLTACGDKQQDLEQQSLQHIKQTKAYTEQGQFRPAMIEARNAIQKAPKNPEAHIALANVLLEMNQPQPALDQLEQIPEEARNSTSFILSKADALIKRGKFQTALSILETPEAENTAEATLLKAQAMQGLGELDEAIEAYQGLPQTNIEAQLGLARLYAQKENLRGAFEILLLLKESAPNNPEVRFFEAALASRDGDLQRTEALLTETLSLLPNTDVMTPLKGNVMRAMVDTLTKLGRASEALVYSKALSEAYPGSDLAQAKYKESVELFQKGQMDEAKSILVELVDTYPQFEQGAQLLGIINYLQGDYESANSYFNDHLDPETATELAANIAAETNLKLNQPGKVIELLGTNIDKTTNPETLALYGIASLASGNTQQGIDAVKRSLKEKPDNNRLRLLLANYYNSINNPDAALEQIQTAYQTSAGKKDPIVQNALAKLFIKLDKTDEAKQLLNTILSESPDNPTSYLVVADVEVYRNNYSAAEAHYKSALKLESDNPSALMGYANASIWQKKWTQALEGFTKLASLQPNSIVAYRGILESYKAQKQTQTGIDKVNALKPQASSEIAPYLALAENYVRSQEFAKAYQEIDAAQSISDENASQRLNQTRGQIAYFEASVAINAGDIEQAKASAIKGLQSDPNSIQLLTGLIRIETKLGNFSEGRKLAQQLEERNYYLYRMILGDIDLAQDKKTSALALFEESWATQPTEVVGQKIYTLRHSEQSPEKARSFLNDWLSKIPDSLTAMTLDSDYSLAVEDYSKAITVLEKIARAAPNSPATLNNLAWAYFKTGNDKAVATAKKAYDLLPQNAAVADTYGWILVNANQVTKGIQILEKAAQISPEIQEIQDHLAEAKKLLN